MAKEDATSSLILLQKMKSLKRAILHPLFCACASCASASTYVCAPMCTVSTCVYMSSPTKCHMWSHLHTYVCMRLHMHMYITILKDDFLNKKITFVLLYRFLTYS